MKIVRPDGPLCHWGSCANTVAGDATSSSVASANEVTQASE